MGILTNGPHGKMKGRTGNLVGRATKHGNVISARPHVSNKPASDDQLDVRGKLAMMSSFLSMIPTVINNGFKKYTSKMSAMNAAMKYNLKNAVYKNEEYFEIDISKVVLSKGPLFPPEEAAVTSEPGQKIVISWLPEPEDTEYNAENDMVTIVIYNPTHNQFTTAVNKAIRSDGIYTMQLSTYYEGDVVHCYMNFTSEKGKVSDSVYIGETLVI